MREYWVVSDTHFFHAKSLERKDDGGLVRPGFSSVGEMNECMVENWNAKVKDGDYVYQLGDVVCRQGEGEFEALWGRLKGRKRLCVGNHDDIKYLVRGGFFSKVQFWKYFHEFGLILSHMPLHPKSFEPASRFAGLGHIPLNVHGHLHNRPSPEGPYYNACVELNGYAPVNLETLAEIARKQGIGGLA